MKTYKHLFEKMLTPETVKLAALDAADGKIGRPEVLRSLINFDEMYDYVVSCARDPNWEPYEDNRHEIIDGANHKQREIEKPMFCPEQILHHMLIEPFKPVLLNGLYEQVYGCLPKSVKKTKEGKYMVRKYGPLAATRQLMKWVQIGKKVYVAETDVHHAYGSVRISKLAEQMRRVIRDEQWLRLAYKFLHYQPGEPESEDRCGLILGHYTSPWFFNFYLKDFDHYAASRPGVKYLRFADNIFLVGRNKRQVHQDLHEIREYLRDELHLELNGSTQVYRFEYVNQRTKRVKGRAVNALGSVIHYNRVTLRKSILMRMRRKAHRISRKQDASWHDGASMFSRIAWVRHTDTFTYYKEHVKPFINTRLLKRKVRAHSKRMQSVALQRRRTIYDAMEKSARLSVGAPPCA